jgi:hypothetical protein
MTMKFGISVAMMGSLNDFKSVVSSRHSSVSSSPWSKRVIEGTLGPKEGGKVERYNVDLHKAEFSLLVRGISDDGGRVSSQFMLDHQVEEVLQSSGPWIDCTQGCNGLSLDEL